MSLKTLTLGCEERRREEEEEEERRRRGGGGARGEEGGGRGTDVRWDTTKMAVQEGVGVLKVCKQGVQYPLGQGTCGVFGRCNGGMRGIILGGEDLMRWGYESGGRGSIHRGPG
eukprot:602779-Hanusia_phi.AAC.4